MAFDYPPRRDTVPSRQRNQAYQMRQERRKPVLPGPWVYVGDFDAVDPPVVTWQSPPWENGWTWVDTAYVGFRHGLDGETEFVGVVDATGATSGTVAFTLPLPWRPVKEYSFITDLDFGGGDFDAARVLVNLDGEVTIYFPLTA